MVSMPDTISAQRRVRRTAQHCRTPEHETARQEEARRQPTSNKPWNEFQNGVRPVQHRWRRVPSARLSTPSLARVRATCFCQKIVVATPVHELRQQGAPRSLPCLLPLSILVRHAHPRRCTSDTWGDLSGGLQAQAPLAERDPNPASP